MIAERCGGDSALGTLPLAFSPWGFLPTCTKPYWPNAKCSELRWLPLRAEQRKQMTIGVAEICRPHRPGDISRLLAKLYTLSFQCFVRCPHVIHRENHFGRACQWGNVLSQRLT